MIAVFTKSGASARMISNYRPRQPIVAFSPDEDVRREISLLWGVQPLRAKPMNNAEDIVNFAEQGLLGAKLVRKGDLVGIVAGIPVGVGGTTNFVRFHVVGGGVHWREDAR